MNFHVCLRDHTGHAQTLSEPGRPKKLQVTAMQRVYGNDSSIEIFDAKVICNYYFDLPFITFLIGDGLFIYGLRFFHEKYFRFLIVMNRCKFLLQSLKHQSVRLKQ